MDLEALARKLEPVAIAAGREIERIHALGPDADVKPDGSPVCAADRAAEMIVVSALAQIAPDIAIVAEEDPASHKRAAASRFFLVDALDGTKEFLKRDGKGAYTVNIGLIEDGEPVMGVVYAPALDRLFSGADGGVATETRSGVLTRLTCRTKPETGPVAVASCSHGDAQTDAWLRDENVNETVLVGSSLKFCMLAAGEADVYPRFTPTMEWDTAAGHAILRAAGGSVTRPDGSAFTYGKERYRNGPFIARAAVNGA